MYQIYCEGESGRCIFILNSGSKLYNQTNQLFWRR